MLPRAILCSAVVVWCCVVLWCFGAVVLWCCGVLVLSVFRVLIITEKKRVGFVMTSANG